MFQIIKTALSPRILNLSKVSQICYRTFLSQAYYCNEVWEDRLTSPLLQKVNLDVLYHELDQRFQKTRRLSAVDVDIFANSIKNDVFIDEVLDLVHKLRLTPDTGNTLDSTGHAVIRTLLKYEKISELLQALDDRLNYGIFLDDYTGNILMDKFWKDKNYVAGALIASQFMLQEDFAHPVTINFAILHCYNYLLNPGEWPQAPTPEEPEEEVKVRVKYLRNSYEDEHFDLKDPKKIVGKTLAEAAKNLQNPIHKSLRILGLVLLGKEEQAQIEATNTKLIKEIIDLLPEENSLKKTSNLTSEDVNIFLENQLNEAIAQTSEKDIANQCETYKNWETQRLQALENQKRRLLIAERLAEVEKLKQDLKTKEQKLWFFENEEEIELNIEERSSLIPQKKIEEKKIEENYIPPEIR